MARTLVVLSIVVALVLGAWAFQEKRCDDYRKLVAALAGEVVGPNLDYSDALEMARAVADEPWPGC